MEHNSSQRIAYRTSQYAGVADCTDGPGQPAATVAASAMADQPTPSPSIPPHGGTHRLYKILPWLLWCLAVPATILAIVVIFDHI